MHIWLRWKEPCRKLALNLESLQSSGRQEEAQLEEAVKEEKPEEEKKAAAAEGLSALFGWF